MIAVKAATVDEYIAAFPPQVQKMLKQVRATIKKIASAAEEQISYAMPGYKLHGKPLVYFGGYPNHIGFYPTPVGMEEFKEELSKYKTGKGSVQFPLDEPLPVDLITRIIRFRIAEVEASVKPKKKGK